MYALCWEMLLDWDVAIFRLLLSSGCCRQLLSISALAQGINQDTLFLSVGGMFLSLAGAVISGFLIRSAWVRPGLIQMIHNVF